MNWLNGCSKNLFLKALDKYKKISPKLLLIENNKNGEQDYLNTLETKPEPLLSTKIINLIEQDDAGIFRSEHIRGKPQANFRAIVLMNRDGYGMKEIEQYFTVPLQTLHTFYKKCTNKYRDYIKDNI